MSAVQRCLKRYRTYRVSGQQKAPLLDFITEALRRLGCMILVRSPPTEAPFRIIFDTNTGERMGVIAYAFDAKQLIRKGCPADEYHFHVEYGSKDDRLDELWQD